MKRTKQYYIILSVSILFFVAVLILGTIYDLQISKALAIDIGVGSYYSKNLFAIIFECVGEDVLYVFLLCSFSIMFFYFLRNTTIKKWLRILFLIFFIICSIMCTFYGLCKTLNYISNYVDPAFKTFINGIVGLIISACISIIIIGILYFLFSKIKKETINALTGFALSVIIVSAVSNGIVQFGKIIFDRTRYRAMIYEGYTNFEYYTNWYQINTNKFNSVSSMAGDYFKSFPSGHTCAAASTFLLILLPNFLPQTNNKKCKISFTIFAIIYTMLVALSRIIVGAHFFTDVLIGGMVTVICVLLVKRFLVNKLNFLNK